MKALFRIVLTAALMIQGVCAMGQQSVGLVLSGGGAKGIAHIGVIQALEENDIPIDYITGTSMGAIVGGLYAAGYTPDEMMQMLLSREFGYWSTGQIDPKLEFYFHREEQSPAMLSVPLTLARDSARIDSTAVPASLISPLPMSFAFMQLFAAYDAQCGSDFDNLFVPFRCCASDVAKHRRVVIGSGNFGDAIRSSMSFPIVFQPTEFEDMLLYDGGIYDNFPVDVMNDTFAPDFILGIDVSSEDKGPQTSLMDQISNLVIQHSDYSLDPSNGIKIRFDLDRFSLLDFPQARAIYQIGYDKTISMIDSIKSRIHSRTPKEYRDVRRAVFKSQTPYIKFDRVDVSGGTQQQNRYIHHMFEHAQTDTFGIIHARDAYYRAISSGKLNDLQPHAIYNDSTGLFALTLKASIKNDLKAGVGGYVTSSNSSYVFLSAGYSTYSFNSLSAKISGWLGQSYMAGMLTTRMFLPTPFDSSLGLEAVASRRGYFHSDNMFYNINVPAFVRAHEYYGRLKWSVATGLTSMMDVGVGLGHIYDSFFMPVVDTGSNTSFKHHSHFGLGQAFVRYLRNTLDDVNYPTSGASCLATAMAVTGKFWQKIDGEVNDRENIRWLQAECVTRNYLTMGRHFSFGIESDVMLSTRKLLRDYNTTIVAAPVYNPTPASNNSFNPAFRANSFAAVGIVPIYRYSDNLSARLSLNCFLPLRSIVDAGDGLAAYARGWLSHPKFYGEFDVCYKLPFATVVGYCNYASSAVSRWNVGISFGVYLLAPRFLR